MHPKPTYEQLLVQIELLKKENEKLKSNQTWHPISEFPRGTMKSFLVWAEGLDEPWKDIYDVFENKWLCTCDLPNFPRPTHFMKLPDVPYKISNKLWLRGEINGK
jgi:hypothetical protein